MKALKVLLMAPVAALMLSGVVAAREYKQMVPQQTRPMTQEQIIQQQQQTQQPGFIGMPGARGPMHGMPMARAGEGVFFVGNLSGVDTANREIIVRSDVLGLTGPQKRDIPFAIGHDTTMTLCVKSINACESYSTGEIGFLALNNLEASLGNVSRNVIIVGVPDSNRVVHAHIEYLG